MSTGEVFSNILSTNEEPVSYYGEGKMTIYQGDEITEDILFEEYAGTNGQKKVITKEQKSGVQSTAVNDGELLINYQEGSDTAQSIDLSGTGLPTTLTQKEQLINMLDTMKDSHSAEVIGEEKVLDFNTYHIKLTADSKSSILGDTEFWVDQKTWFIVKTYSTTGEIRSEMEYTKLDLNPNFADDTFTLDLPKGVEIVAIDDTSVSGTIEDAEQALETAFLVIDDQDQQLDHIEIDELQGEINRTEVTLYYVSDDVPSFSLSIFPTPEGPGMEMDNGNLKVREHQAAYMKDIRNISWDEQGLRYSILIDHPDLTAEDMIKLAETMKLSSEL